MESTHNNNWPEDVITKKLLTEVLQIREKGEDVVVKSFEMSNIKPAGKDFVSRTLRIHVSAVIGGKDTKRHLVAKVTLSEGHLASFAKEGRVFEKENMMYTQFFPSATRMQADVLHPVQLSIPKVLKSVVTDELTYIIMEDCSVDGFVKRSYSGRFDYEHCKLVVEEIAKFHALSVALGKGSAENLTSEYGVLFEENYYNKDHLGLFILPLVRYAIATCVSIFQSIIKDTAKVKRVQKLYNLDLEKFILNAVKPDDQFNVICHADLNVGNMLFKYDSDDPNTVTDVKIIDFQTVRFASPVTDLLFFLYPNLTTSSRKENIDSLLHAYHKTMVDSLQKFNLESKCFTFDSFVKQFHCCSLFGVLMKLLFISGFSPFLGPPDLPAISSDCFTEARKACDALIKAGEDKEIVECLIDAIDQGFL